MELWLKRYLSLFFDFEHFGNLSWLAIPLFIYFLITIKKRKRWEMAIIFVFFLSCLSLGIKGHGYPRYLFTLYPFTLTVIFLFGWEFIKKKRHPFQIGIFIILTLAVFFNYYHSREAYRFFWKYKVSVVDDYFPHELIKYINTAEDFDSNSTTLVYSRAFFFFYYTDKKGIFYRDPKLRAFYIQQNEEEALNILKNQLKVKYILVSWKLRPNGILKKIITNDCDLVYQDEGIYLYRIREKDIDKDELEKLFVNDSILRNSSLENWSRGPLNKPDFFEGGDNVFDDMVIREEKEVRAGKYSAKITGDNFNFAQNLSNFEDYKGKTLTCFAWIKTNVPNKYRIQIYDGIKSSFSNIHSGRGSWELLQANYTVNPSAEIVTIRIIQAEQTGNVDDVVYVDGALLVEGDWNTFYLYKQHMKEKLDKFQKDN